jgi:hypothetical protein
MVNYPIARRASVIVDEFEYLFYLAEVMERI